MYVDKQQKKDIFRRRQRCLFSSMKDNKKHFFYYLSYLFPKSCFFRFGEKSSKTQGVFSKPKFTSVFFMKVKKIL